jgi:hypothetical protein
MRRAQSVISEIVTHVGRDERVRLAGLRLRERYQD